MSNHNVHKVSSDALETLGTIIDGNAGRDAIHVAVEPVQAGQILAPGLPVILNGGKAYRTFGDDAVGIVDPFLKTYVAEGQHFWLLVMPRTITSLRHVWSHPAFGEAEEPLPSGDKAESEAWLRDFCDNNDCADYDTILDSLVDYRDGDEYFTIHGQDAHGDIPARFWHHVSIVTGRKFSNPAGSFSCSC